MTLLNLLIFLKNTNCNFDKIIIYKIGIEYDIKYKYYLNDNDFYILKNYLNYQIKEFITNDKSAIVIL